MRYIGKEDLIQIIQQRLLDDSLQLDENILDGLETKAIAFATSYISGRYDCEKIFGLPYPQGEGREGEVLRNELLVQAISMLVVYWTVRRNAARKVPDDYTHVYNEAVRILSNVQAGSQKLDGLPTITGEDGTSSSFMYGNTTDKDFFI